jgi:hypothetical protein
MPMKLPPRFACALAILVTPSLAVAEVYKCVKDGEVKYQQEPCEQASAQTRLTLPDSSGVRAGPQRTGTQPSSRPSANPPRSFANLPASMASAACPFPWGAVPPDTLVYAVTLPGGRPGIGFPIDQSGDEAISEQVIVNHPGKRVALLLSFTAPTVWHVKWTPNTEIVAVWASGHDRQGVVGLPKSAPLLRTAKNVDASPCGWFAFSTQNFPHADKISLKAFQRPLAATVMLDEQKWVGLRPDPNARLLSSDDVTARSFESKEGWGYGRVALEKLERDGFIRKARRQEVWDWEDEWAKRNDVPPVENLQRPGRPADLIDVYVIQKPFQVPRDMHAKLLIPKGMNPPTGDLNLLGLLDTNTITCFGSACYPFAKQPYPTCGRSR